MLNPLSAARASSRTAFALIALSLVLGSSSLLAATRTWTGGSSVNNFWATGQNWSGGAAPLAGDDLIFPPVVRLTSVNNFPPGTTFNSLTVIGNQTLSGAAIALNDGIDATAGQIQLNSIKLNAGQTFRISLEDTLVISSAIDTDGRSLTLESEGSLTVSGVISGSGTITKTGAGTVILTGNNTSNASTFLRAGNYLVNGSHPGSTMFIIGSTLGGRGTTGGIRFGFVTDNLAGVLAPGDNEPGILNVSNGVDFNETLGAEGFPTLLIDLEGTAVGTSYDQLNVTGAVNLGTRAQLRVTVGTGFIPTAGDSFTIMKNDGSDAVVGTFLTLPEGATFVTGGITFAISYRGGDGNDVTLTSISAALSFTAGSYSVDEDAGTASITLRRTGSRKHHRHRCAGPRRFDHSASGLPFAGWFAGCDL